LKKEKFDQLILQLERYCDYRERCAQDVRAKLQKQGLNKQDVEELIDYLIEHNSIDEKRYAIQFAHGKNKYNKWGKNKIYAALIAKRIDAHIIQSALDEMDDDLYRQTLETLYKRKFDSLSKETSYIRKNKTIKSCMDKGYSYEQILSILEEK
jgi:regulatory protein